MTPSLPPLPIPETRSASFEIPIEAAPTFGFPGAVLTLCVWCDDLGEPAVESAMLRINWPEKAPARFARLGDLNRKREVQVLDQGQVAIEFDSLGRVDNVEATAFIPGPKFAPETVALQEATQQKHGILILSALATIMRHWPNVEAFYRAHARLDPHPLAVAAEARKMADQRPWASASNALQEIW